MIMIINAAVKDFIGIYDTDIDTQPFIDYYNRAEQSNVIWSHRNAIERRDSKASLNLHNPDVLLMNIPGDEGAPEYVKKYNDIIEECMNCYADTYPHLLDYQFQTLHINVKKTIPKHGYHIWHCENNDAGCTRRLIATMLYLNDVTEGGETEFQYQSLRVQPKAGRVVIWPAGFTHMHRGNPPLKEEKYVANSWLEQFKL